MKFRVWDKEYYEGFGFFDLLYLSDMKSYSHYLEQSENKEIILNISTGLKDRNGVEIYEGDIVKNKYERSYLILFGEYDNKDLYGDRELGIGFFAKEVKDLCVSCDIWSMFTSEYSLDYGVIGNIYEKRGLLYEV